MIVLGLTGSIGMGKTTTAGMFADEGVPVHDSDQAVRDLYAPGGAAVGPVEAAFPGVTVAGGIDRDRLAARVTGDPGALKRLEAIVHPLVAAHRHAFLARGRTEATPVVVIDVPLLFEVGLGEAFDAVVVASAPAEVQRARVLARPGMTEVRFAALLARQLPDAEKRARADFVVDTSQGLEPARAQVRQILRTVRDPAWRPKDRLVGPGEATH